MSTEDLLAAQAKLTQQYLSLGPYASQTIGGKSWTKDSRALQGMLESIQFVLNERGATGEQGYQGVMVTDFSENSIPQGQPAGVVDQLSY